MKKRTKDIKVWDRDIICIPQSVRNKTNCGTYMYPRGKYRSYLGRVGLIGKLHLTSEMGTDDVVSEICSVFKSEE